VDVLKDKSGWLLNERVNAVFDETVTPVFHDLVKAYNGAGGYAVETVYESPLITGIKRYASIMVTHPGGLEMIVCVYWVEGSSMLVAENISMVTLSKTFDLNSVTRQELTEQLKFLCGLVR
jgi:hypothetical protein